MSLDQATLLRVTTQDTIMGLRQERGAFADMVCTKFSKAALAGTEPLFASSQTMANRQGGQAVGTTLFDKNIKLESANWNMLEFAKKFRIPKAQMTDMDQYMDTNGEAIALLANDADADVDAALAALLVNASFNQSQAVGAGVWTLTTSSPALDLQTALNKTPGADIAIFGKATFQKLGRHPDVKERVSNYSGKGTIGAAATKSALADILEMDASNIYVFGKYYNSANPGQTAVLAYAALDLAWVGHKAALRMYEQNNSLGEDRPSNEGLVSVVDDHNAWEIGYRRTLDIIRPDSYMGCFVTGTV
jgi:hypothetical protein